MRPKRPSDLTARRAVWRANHVRGDLFLRIQSESALLVPPDEPVRGQFRSTMTQ